MRPMTQMVQMALDTDIFFGSFLAYLSHLLLTLLPVFDRVHASQGASQKIALACQGNACR